jgi:peptidoglycan hydrolase CwlO-like protein
MRRFSIIFIVVLFVAVLLISRVFVYADELEDINNKLNELNKSLDDSKKATATNEQQLTNLNAQLESIKAQVNKIENDIDKKEKDIVEGEKRLAKQKILLDERIVSYYKNKGKEREALLQVVVTNNFSLFLKQFTYQQNLLDGDRKTIVRIALLIKDIEDKKAGLEKEKQQLIPIKDQIAKQSTFLSGEVASAKTYQSQLQQQIVTLSARQKDILSQRLASLNIPQSAYTTQGGCKSDIDEDPGFSPRIAFFTFGVPNRVGLNQYGAKGRADANQNYDTILRAYYNFDSYQDGASAEIKVNDGNGINQGNIIWTGSLEDYVKRVYEMPSGWPSEALKAQVIAIRSYVLAATNNGANSICANQYCQVFKDSEKDGQWVQAVNDTSGKVMIQGGSPIKAWFSSTHGGVIFSSGEIGWSSTGWTKHGTDTPSGSASSFDDLKNNAFDRSSPWFYCVPDFEFGLIAVSFAPVIASFGLIRRRSVVFYC